MMRDLSFMYLIGNKMDLDQASTHSLIDHTSNMHNSIREVDFDEGQEFS